jgi:hypothetical protein
VNKGQRVGVKKVPVESLDGLDQIRILNPLNRLSSIGLIPHNRMPQMLKMDAYLMRSSSVRIDAKIAEISIVAYRLVAGEGFAGTPAAS